VAERIAVEEGLSNIKEHLSRHGYQVVGFDDGLHDAEAVVISGGDRDFLGFTEPHTGAPVISAGVGRHRRFWKICVDGYSQERCRRAGKSCISDER